MYNKLWIGYADDYLCQNSIFYYLSIIIFQNGFLWIVVEQYNNKTMDENDATDANTPRDAISTMEVAADEVILRII